MHVLVVDDERNIRRTLRDIFEDNQFDVSTADRGERAVSMCLDHDYDLVLMDVRMPGIDGLEAVHELRRKGCLVPIIMMSGYRVEQLMKQALADGVIAFMQKPLDIAKVISLMRSYSDVDADPAPDPQTGGDSKS